jgi:hypothetical protein
MCKSIAIMSMMLVTMIMVAVLGMSGCTVTERPGEIVVRGEPFVVREAPPPLREEVIGVAPSPRHIWVPGYWAWHDGWAWEPGRWALRPYHGAEWHPGHWARHPNGWVWVSGHWR